MGDKYIFVKDSVESIGRIEIKNIDEHTINVSIGDETIILNIDDESNIILKTDNYEIIDIDKIVEFEYDELEAL